MMRAFYSLQHSSTGLTADNVLTLRMTLAESRYGSDRWESASSRPRSVRHFHDIEERISQIPGVTSVAFISLLPLQSWGTNGNLTVVGRTQDSSNQPLVELRVVSPSYFRTMGVPILRGREFNAQDDMKSPPVVMINETAVRQYFPNEDPIGKITNR